MGLYDRLKLFVPGDDESPRVTEGISLPVLPVTLSEAEARRIRGPVLRAQLTGVPPCHGSMGHGLEGVSD